MLSSYSSISIPNSSHNNRSNFGSLFMYSCKNSSGSHGASLQCKSSRISSSIYVAILSINSCFNSNLLPNRNIFIILSNKIRDQIISSLFIILCFPLQFLPVLLPHRHFLSCNLQTCLRLAPHLVHNTPPYIVPTLYLLQCGS